MAASPQRVVTAGKSSGTQTTPEREGEDEDDGNQGKRADVDLRHQHRPDPGSEERHDPGARPPGSHQREHQAQNEAEQTAWVDRLVAERAQPVENEQLKAHTEDDATRHAEARDAAEETHREPHAERHEAPVRVRVQQPERPEQRRDDRIEKRPVLAEELVVEARSGCVVPERQEEIALIVRGREGAEHREVPDRCQHDRREDECHRGAESTRAHGTDYPVRSSGVSNHDEARLPRRARDSRRDSRSTRKTTCGAATDMRVSAAPSTDVRLPANSGWTTWADSGPRRGIASRTITVQRTW